MYTMSHRFCLFILLLFDYVYRDLCEMNDKEQIIFIILIRLPVINIIFALKA